MSYGIIDILTLLGSLGVFLFGMKFMSEALQKIAGNRMRGILASMTSNRVLGVMTGFIVTAFIQSSSATTVLVVSFVNAGLLSFTQSVGVIMGANIGTTVTAWLISILGFKVSISSIALPLIAVGFPLLFARKSKIQSWGEFLIGFSILFIGLQYLKESVPDIRSNPEILSFLAQYVEGGYLSIMMFIFIGTVLTIILQSSSATMALTLVMCNQGWIPFEMAAAMVLGENIGTTITANLAAFVGNTAAKRTARAHLLFNVIGVIWILIVFMPFLKMVGNVATLDGSRSPFESAIAIPIALSIFHTSFNIINTFLLIWFVPVIVKIVEKWVPSKKDEEGFQLKYISTGLMSTAELSLLQAQREIGEYTLHIIKMFALVRKLFKETNENKFNKLLKKIDSYEEVNDQMEEAIALYLTKISQNKLSDDGATDLRSMYRLVEDIEDIGDEFMNITRILAKKKMDDTEFNEYINDSLNSIFDLMEQALSIMDQNVKETSEEILLEEAYLIKDKIHEFRDKLKQDNIENVREGKYMHKSGLVYNDIVSKSEKAADHTIQVAETTRQMKKGKKKGKKKDK